MSTIVTRAGKGSPLSWIEADANLTNLNTDKLEASALAPYETSAHAAATYAPITTAVTDSDIGVTVQAYSANLAEYAAVNPTTAGLALLDDIDAVAQRTTLGLGTASTLDVGTAANNLVQLNGSAQLPAVDGSLLTNLVSLAISSTAEAQGLSNNTKAISPLRLDEAFQGANQTLAATGFQNFPGGFKVKWGTVSATSGGQGVTFTAAFPTSCYAVLIQGNGAGSYYQTQVSSVTASGFTVTSPSGTLACFWIAIGK